MFWVTVQNPLLGLISPWCLWGGEEVRQPRARAPPQCVTPVPSARAAVRHDVGASLMEESAVGQDGRVGTPMTAVLQGTA